MSNILSTFLIFVFVINCAFSQKILSGEYGHGLKLAYDPQTKKITGYFESYTGFDFKSNEHKFSCIFYIEGTIVNKKNEILTYYPTHKFDSLIIGSLEITNDSIVKIKLFGEHGDCWNVHHFADNDYNFSVSKNIKWLQIRYVTAQKAHFYSQKSEAKKLKTYVVKNDFLCIDKIDGKWVHGALYHYNGNYLVAKGWIRALDLNR